MTDIIIQQNHVGSVVRVSSPVVFKSTQMLQAILRLSSLFTVLQQAEVPEDSDDDGDPDEVFGLTTMLNLTERKVTTLARITNSLLLFLI